MSWYAPAEEVTIIFFVKCKSKQEREMRNLTNLKIWWAILVFLLVPAFVSLSAQGGTYGGGNGTAANPYQIWTAQQMNTIGTSPGDWDKHFKLMADINLGGYKGVQFRIIGTYPNGFTGCFDGNGKTIRNFTHISPGGDERGLFGVVGRYSYTPGEIKNLRLLNPRVDTYNGQSQSGYWTGALAGEVINGVITNCCAENIEISGGFMETGGLVGRFSMGEMTDCHTTGIVSSAVYMAGGLVGMNIQGTISRCYSQCDVSSQGYVGGLLGSLENEGSISECYSAGTVEGEDHLGGLAGHNWGTISDCYSTSTVTITGLEAAGGLVGCNHGPISRCYSAGRVVGYAWSVGGLLGNRAGTITSCFWDMQTSGQSDGVGDGSSSGVTGKTTAEMKGQNMFAQAGWDFVEQVTHDPDEVWTMCRWADYPRFAWQVSVADSVYYVDGVNGTDPTGEPNEIIPEGTPFATIQRAIDTAWHGNTIIVLPGRYHENINFGAKRLTLRSFDPNHPEETIIDGNDLGSVVTFVGSENADCRLTGFTITGGNASENGGGINGNFTKATISNCIIKDNISQDRGGGVARCDGVLDRCIITGNDAKNRGGGVLASNCTIINCLIYDNSVGYIEGSTEGHGGGLYYCSGDIINCTIAFNAANGRAGGFDVCNGTIANCIVWGNDLEQLLNCSVPAYSCIQNWTGIGTGNISTDPEFVDPNNGDYHLLAGSPCIDAGDPNYVAAPNATDLDGKPRIINGVVDIGAYEAVVPAMVEVEMKFTPQALNPGSGGKWVKAHLVLPEGFGVDDVDADTPSEIEQLGIESEYMNVFINEDSLVEIEAAFRRGDFCGAIDYGPGEVTVIGRLTSGQYFCGSDTIRIITNKLGYVADIASYWLQADCGPPDWCGGLDVDQDSVVDWLDFAMSDSCCIKVIEE